MLLFQLFVVGSRKLGWDKTCGWHVGLPFVTFSAVWSECVMCFVSPPLHNLGLEPNRHFTLAVDFDVLGSLIIPINQKLFLVSRDLFSVSSD